MDRLAQNDEIIALVNLTLRHLTLPFCINWELYLHIDYCFISTVFIVTREVSKHQVMLCPQNRRNFNYKKIVTYVLGIEPRHSQYMVLLNSCACIAKSILVCVSKAMMDISKLAMVRGLYSILSIFLHFVVVVVPKQSDSYHGKIRVEQYMTHHEFHDSSAAWLDVIKQFCFRYHPINQSNRWG